MSWDDGISEADTLLPLFGSVGLIIFIIICLCNWCQHSNIMATGIKYKVVEIGTCKDSTCILKVRSHEGDIYTKETGGKVFVGDTVTCGSEWCYKD